MKRILITGSLGHIGSKFIHSIDANIFDEVRMIDNMSTQRFASLYHLPKNVNFKFIEGDILKVDLVKLTKNIDVVIHLAAITDAQSSFLNRQEVEHVNFEGTRRVAEACIETSSSLLFPSTTSVYGTQSKVVDENCPTDELKPQSPYAESKLKSEQMLFKMGSEQKLNFIICRFGTIFGTSIGMRFHTAVNKFCWQAVMGVPLTVWKTAIDQKRPYLGVNDAVNAIYHIIQNQLFDNNIYNIVSANYTVRDIINYMKKIRPSLNIEFVDTEIMNQLSYEVISDRISKCNFSFNDNLFDEISTTLKLININNNS